ncbi:glycosyltransferase [Sphingomonas sp. SUN019]|uniref:glycosyltransferase family 2 protein n=1 Tax=Sphingomonas sp. SUN019 TaxID=2937788 RepID=UPI00216407DB|nr:glycosyltransferase family A protein [Sphingomonas sp. SUN019]UVO50510.1 glycosyltransferase [Sphingomonas sp. SUN019]
MTKPVISVIMAAYNGAALIRETLASLSAQTFGDFEVIVVDDRSTDDTLAVLAAWPDPRVRVIALAENGGPVRARNRAFAEARGRYIAALDQDDLCRPERFARQVAYLDVHPDCVLIGSATAVLEDVAVGPSAYPVHTTPALLRWLTMIENPLVWSSVMIRAAAARALDPFTRPDILYAEDFDLYHRIAAIGEIARLDDDLLVYRRHAGGASQRYETIMLASATRVLAEAYTPVFADKATDAAACVVHHLMHRQPAADRATLARLGQALVRLQEAHFMGHACDANDVRLIRWETARRWSAVSRASLREGTITLPDALAVRPPHLGLGHAGIDELVWARLIGRARGLRRRYTFAA